MRFWNCVSMGTSGLRPPEDVHSGFLHHCKEVGIILWKQSVSLCAYVHGCVCGVPRPTQGATLPFSAAQVDLPLSLTEKQPVQSHA